MGVFCVAEVQGRDLCDRVNTEDERHTTAMSSLTDSPSVIIIVFVAPGESCQLSAEYISTVVFFYNLRSLKVL